MVDYYALQKRYEEEFYPNDYIPRIVQRECVVHTFIEEKLHDVFSEINVAPDTKLIDVGCGPTFCNVLAATKKIGDVVLSDLTEKNRREIEKIILGSTDTADMSQNAHVQALREGHADPVKGGEEIIRRTRKAIRKVVPCNVLDPLVLPEEHLETFDIVLSSLCLESATSDAETYTRALKNIGRLVKPAGRIILCGVSGCPGYTSGTAYFPTVLLNRELIRGALLEAGFTIKRWIEDKAGGVTVLNATFDYCYVVVAVKAVAS